MRNTGAVHKGTSSRSQRPCGLLPLDTESSQHVPHKKQMTNPTCIVLGIRASIENLHVSHGKDHTQWTPAHPLRAAHSNHGHCVAIATHPQAPPPNRAAQHSSGNAACICLYAWTRTWKNCKCFCNRSNHTKHWTILQRPTVITRRTRQLSVHGKTTTVTVDRVEPGYISNETRDCHRQITDYHNLQHQHPSTRHWLYKPHALFAVSASRQCYGTCAAMSAGWWYKLHHSMLQYQGPNANSTVARITQAVKQHESKIGWPLGRQY